MVCRVFVICWGICMLNVVHHITSNTCIVVRVRFVMSEVTRTVVLSQSSPVDRYPIQLIPTQICHRCEVTVMEMLKDYILEVAH